MGLVSERSLHWPTLQSQPWVSHWPLSILSFLYHPQPSKNNPSIKLGDFPTSWDTFSITCHLLWWVPPGSQVATRDVSEAYCTIPLHPSQWPVTVICINKDSFAVNTSLCFGASPSAGTYGQVCQVGSDIICTLRIGPLSCHFPCLNLSNHSPHYADNHCFCYNFDNIDQISDQLGIPWDCSKDQPFSHAMTYIGFIWDLASLQVSLSLSKKAKYAIVIMEWKTWATHILNNVKTLYGKLLHACLVIPGRWTFTSLEAMLTTSVSVVWLMWHTSHFE